MYASIPDMDRLILLRYRALRSLTSFGSQDVFAPPLLMVSEFDMILCTSTVPFTAEAIELFFFFFFQFVELYRN
jgi:hypothetical protein